MRTLSIWPLILAVLLFSTATLQAQTDPYVVSSSPGTEAEEAMTAYSEAKSEMSATSESSNTVETVLQTPGLPDRVWFPSRTLGSPIVESTGSPRTLGSPVTGPMGSTESTRFGETDSRLLIRAEHRGQSIVLKFPQDVLPYTVSFKTRTIDVSHHRLMRNPMISWSSPTELSIDRRLARTVDLSLGEFWVWGQIRNGGALMQRVHFE